MGKKRVGAPSILTDELQQKLCSLLSIGTSIEDACTECGISDSTFHKWKQRALEKKERKYLQFLQAVDKAKVQSKLKCLITMDKQANGANAVYKDGKLVKPAIEADWRAAAWLLERRFPQEFGKRDQVKVHEAEKGEDFNPPGSHARLLAHIEYLNQEYQKDLKLEEEE
jgi:transposase-like protein